MPPLRSPARLVPWALLAGVVSVTACADGGRLRDVDGDIRDLFRPAGKASVLIFVSSECPISNGYAPEIQRICADGRANGVTCTGSLTPAVLRTCRR